MGGIGTGVIHFNGNAEPHAWQIFNNYKWVRVPESYLAIRAQAEGGEPVVRALQTVPVGEFPAMEKLQFRGEYPFGWYEFEDSALPVQVSMEIYNPLVPLNARDSGIPCVIVNVIVTNTGSKPVKVDLLAAQLNAVGFTGDKEIEGRAYKGYGKNVNRSCAEKRRHVPAYAGGCLPRRPQATATWRLPRLAAKPARPPTGPRPTLRTTRS